ncbi:cardiolipin synthase B, partial [Streptomyces sp. NPDC088706]
MSEATLAPDNAVPDENPVPEDGVELDARLGDRRSQRLRRRLERLIGIAATEGNSLLPLRNGDEI